MKHILNLGAGVNSTALLLYLIEKKYPLDEVIFADTGAELKETYSYLPKIIKYCKDQKIKFTIVRKKEKIVWLLQVDQSLQNLCERQHIIPSRLSRWCTYKFKIHPIQKHLKPAGVHIQYFGISSEESHRAKLKGRNAKAIRKYPLVENNIDRIGCIDIIKDYGWDIPVKSGCFFCPFQSLKAWQHLYLNHKDQYEIAEFLEKNNSNYPKFIFNTRPLDSLKNRFGEGLSKIDEWIYTPKCESGYCFT